MDALVNYGSEDEQEDSNNSVAGERYNNNSSRSDKRDTHHRHLSSTAGGDRNPPTRKYEDQRQGRDGNSSKYRYSGSSKPSHSSSFGNRSTGPQDSSGKRDYDGDRRGSGEGARRRGESDADYRRNGQNNYNRNRDYNNSDRREDFRRNPQDRSSYRDFKGKGRYDKKYERDSRNDRMSEDKHSSRHSNSQSSMSYRKERGDERPHHSRKEDDSRRQSHSNKDSRRGRKRSRSPSSSSSSSDSKSRSRSRSRSHSHPSSGTQGSTREAHRSESPVMQPKPAPVISPLMSLPLANIHIPPPAIKPTIPPNNGISPMNIVGESFQATNTAPAFTTKSPPSNPVQLPSYYNPNVINPNKYAEQVQKRKLLWGAKKSEDNAAKWGNAQFSQDADGKVASKFMRLMGIKHADPPAELIQQQPNTSASTKVGAAPDVKTRERMFSSMEQQYEVARQATHTMRGVGLGFGSQSRPY